MLLECIREIMSDLKNKMFRDSFNHRFTSSVGASGFRKSADANSSSVLISHGILLTETKHKRWAFEFSWKLSYFVLRGEYVRVCMHACLLDFALLFCNCTCVFVSLCLCLDCLCASSCVVFGAVCSLFASILSLLYFPRCSTSRPITARPFWILNQSSSCFAHYFTHFSLYFLAFHLYSVILFCHCCLHLTLKLL